MASLAAYKDGEHGGGKSCQVDTHRPPSQDVRLMPARCLARVDAWLGSQAGLALLGFLIHDDIEGILAFSLEKTG